VQHIVRQHFAETKAKLSFGRKLMAMDTVFENGLAFQVGARRRNNNFFVMSRFVALVMLVLGAPLALTLWLAIRFTSNGPVIYSQKRLGYKGRPFNLFKFRTMYENAEASGAQWAKGDSDSRVTPVGKFLRASRLDEFPQLWNIVTGDLVFVGPRPERPEFHDILCSQIPGFANRLNVMPGITGLAQIMVGYTASVEEARWKLVYDLEYVSRASFLFDVRLVFATAWFFIETVFAQTQKATWYFSQSILVHTADARYFFAPSLRGFAHFVNSGVPAKSRNAWERGITFFIIFSIFVL
jgi:lipopolysaccharide/colanic/teichoic acid biosynthesis glycosyltransferase